jgi:peptide/nickel transport system substrate-binding protein
MNRKNLQTTLAPLLIAILMITLLATVLGVSTSSVAAQVVPSIPREQTVRLTGDGSTPTTFIPFASGGVGFDACIMYEPLFCVNYATNEIEGILGKSIEWVDPLTIEVKIRPEAYWIDYWGTHTNITADDVKYSFYLYGAFDEYPTGGGQTPTLTDFRERVGSMNNFEIVDDKTFRVHINATFPNSGTVWGDLTSAWEIVPKAVWKPINDQYGWNATGGPINDHFLNDWQSATMPATDKVASGMYLPYWHDDQTTIMIRNENWWGKDIWGLPKPKYFVDHRTPTNDVAAQELAANNIDWCGNYIPGFNFPQNRMPATTFGTYFSKSPFFISTKDKLMIPNQRAYPLGESWLHKAISMVMVPADIGAVSSGYLGPGDPTCIPNYVPLYNATIAQQYAIVNDVAAANAILAQHCYKGVDGRWYTDDGPSAAWLALYPDHAPYTDADPNHAGINVPLGPWKLEDFQGWSDVDAIDLVICNEVTKGLGITLTSNLVDWNTGIADLGSNNFDFVDYVMHLSAGSMYARYYRDFCGDVGAFSHVGDYRNPELTSLISSLDTAAPADQQAIANQIQTIIGENMPNIPIATHPEWYIYNTKYWTGWPNEDNPFLLDGPYEGSTNIAQVQKILLMLEPTGVTSTPTGWPVEYIYAAVAVVVIVILIILGYALMRKRK